MSATPFLDSAIRDARIAKLDARGLVPLEHARAIVRDTEVYQKGEGQMLGGTFVLEADLVWAALLSLEDAEDFVREATRIHWQFHVRGFDNIAPHERYGDGILPWIAHAIDDAGRLHNVPWCRVPCLLAISSEAAFEVAARVRSHTSEGSPDPSGAAEAPLLASWVMRHPEAGWRLWLERILGGDKRLEAAFGALVDKDPRGLFATLAQYLGDERAAGAFEALGLGVAEVSEELRRVLDEAERVDVAQGPFVMSVAVDEAFEEFQCPMWENANYFTAAMRVTGFVHPEGDALVFQSLATGLGTNDIRLEFVGYGPHFGERQVRMWLQETLIDEQTLASWSEDESTLLHHITGVAVRWDERSRRELIELPADGPRHTWSAPLRGASIDIPLVLEPCFVIDGEPRFGPLEAVMLQLAEPPLRDRVFQPNAELLATMDLPADMTPLFTFDHWEHPFEAASTSLDLLAMLEALRERRALRSLPLGTSTRANLLARIEILGGWGSIHAWGDTLTTPRTPDTEPS